MLCAYEMIEHFYSVAKPYRKKWRWGPWIHTEEVFKLLPDQVTSTLPSFCFSVCCKYVIIIPADNSRYHSTGISTSSSVNRFSLRVS